MVTRTLSRFLSKVIKDYSTNCWLWTGSRLKGGYGKLEIKGKTKLAHRVSYELFVDEIPESRAVRHTCDNPRCVNPEHLQLGTQKDNIQDKVNKCRQSRGINHYLSKLTGKDIKFIRSMRGLISQTKLGLDFNVNSSTIGKIQSYKTYNDII